MKRLLVLSDIHAGSCVGVFPHEYFDPSTEMITNANQIQSFLFEQWRKMVDEVGHVDAVIVNGDSVEGVNKAEEGKGIVTTDLMTQCYIAQDLLSMISTDRFYFTSGSPYHTKGNINCDQILCNLMGGKWIGTNGFINVEDVKIHTRHKISYSSVPYGRTTSQRKEAFINRAQDMDIDIYIRSHTHKYYFSGDSNDLTINTPCWKGLDDYMGVGSQEMPDNGYVLIEVDGINYDWSSYIFNVPLRMYTPTFTI